MKLTGKERWLLIFEGVVTAVLLLLIDWSMLTIITNYIHRNPGLQNGIFEIKSSLVIGPHQWKIWSYQWIGMGIAVAVDLGVLIWRLVRRYHLYQMRHIIKELHYIADGHFKHRVPYRLGKNLQPIIDSVNALVDAQIRAREDERAIERSKDEMITNVSHDLRTPLTSIIGYLGLVENSVAPLSPELIKKYTHTAYAKASQMKALVEDLFEFAQVQQLDMRLNFQEINLSDMLEQLAASFELEAKQKNLMISAMTNPDDILIQADSEKLARLFMNLIQNGLKYGDGASFIKLTASLRQGDVEIRVTNDGAKIPADSVEHLFDRFYRVEGSRSTQTGGTGLGLAIARGVVDAHRGELRVTSDDALTAFIITLPVKQAPREENNGEN